MLQHQGQILFLVSQEYMWILSQTKAVPILWLQHSWVSFSSVYAYCAHIYRDVIGHCVNNQRPLSAFQSLPIPFFSEKILLKINFLVWPWLNLQCWCLISLWYLRVKNSFLLMWFRFSICKLKSTSHINLMSLETNVFFNYAVISLHFICAVDISFWQVSSCNFLIHAESTLRMR